MHRLCASSVLGLAIVRLLTLPAYGQSVISTRSGVVHFFDGAVFLADQPLEAQVGKFPIIPPSAELRTRQGRAEVLLTPGVFLRMGAESSIRMLADDLSDTRVELVSGSAVVDVMEPAPDTSVTLIYRDWKVQFRSNGVYRIDAEPPHVWVRQGLAEVSAIATGASVRVAEGMDLPFAAVLVPEPADRPAPSDDLNSWSEGRRQSISADNAIASQISDDPTAAKDPGLGFDNFTYFPMLGLTAPPIAGSSPYGSVNPYGALQFQSGFNSLYLPGYTYRPFFIGLRTGGFRPIPYRSPVFGSPVYTSPGIGTPGMHAPSFVPGRPPAVGVAPIRSVPAHPAPRVGGVHAAGHR